MKKLVKKQSLRKKQERRTLSLVLFSGALIMFLSIGCFRIWSNAQDKDTAPLYKYYTSIEVNYGDTLWDIASKYCDDSYPDYDAFIEEVMLINRMLEPEISAGSYIIIPYYSSEYLA